MIFGDQVVKMPFEEWGKKVLSVEADTLTQLEARRIGTSIPQVIHYDTEHHILITSRIPGTPVTAETFHTMSSSELASVGQQIGQFLLEMHQFENFSHARDASLAPYYRDVASLCDDPEVCLKAGLHLRDIEHVRAYLLNQPSLNDQIRFLHTDVGYGNVLYDTKSRSVSVIDFGGCRADFRHKDFVKMGDDFPEIVQTSCISTYNSKAEHPLDIDMINVSRLAIRLCKARENGVRPFEKNTPQPN